MEWVVTSWKEYVHVRELMKSDMFWGTQTAPVTIQHAILTQLNVIDFQQN